MQSPGEVGKWVTDGVHLYPYNMFLDKMLKEGKLQWSEPPDRSKVRSDGNMPVTMRSPLTMSPDERMTLAKQLGITLADVNNMSPQELATAEAALTGGKDVTTAIPDGMKLATQEDREREAQELERVAEENLKAAQAARANVKGFASAVEAG